MKKRINPVTSKVDTFLSTTRRTFANRFNHVRNIKFNPRPFQKGERSEDKQCSIKRKIKSSYVEIAKEIDDSLEKREKEAIIKDGIDAHSQDKWKVSLIEPKETKEALGKKIELLTVKTGGQNHEIFEHKNMLQKEENNEFYPIFTKMKLVDEHEHNKNLVNEKTGFGWKGLGSRRIVFDNRIKEYRYEVIEPQLDAQEEDIKDKLIYLFRTRADLDVFDMDNEKKMQYLQEALNNIIDENHLKIGAESKDRIFYYIFRNFLGYGKIDILMHDEEIEDISCGGHGIPIFIFHKKHESISSNIAFTEADALDSFVVKLSQMCGKQISVYEPVVDGKLSDGSRLQTTLARTITPHSTFTVRKFREDPLTPVDLIANNTISVHMAAYFWMAIEQSSSILFCGGTATGKTTMLNALSLFLPSSYKIVSIEDTREINLPHKNWIAGTTRTG